MSELFLNVLNYKKPAFWIILIAVLFAAIIGIGLLADPGDKSSNENSDSNNSSEEDAQISISQPDSQELEDEITRDKDSIIEGFSEMDVYIKDYTFENTDGTKTEAILPAYNIHGAYDLDGDGEVDKINALLKSDFRDGGYIEVNGMNVPLEPHNPSGEMYIIDLDSNDSYTEVAVFDNGPSGDFAFIFFRYDGEKLYQVGTIDRYALMDGQGKFISWFHLANNFKPQFFSAWGEFKNNEYVISDNDVQQYIGETYEVNGVGYFVPSDNSPEDYFAHAMWEPEFSREFKEAKVKLLDIYRDQYDPILNWFYVELADGERGILYFWIGD